MQQIYRSNREIWLSIIAIIAITLMYIFVVVSFREIPDASELFGHGIGIIGFILMLMTETLYTLRKRSRSARWGRMSDWLQFHIFTGLVGPYLVLIHSSWKFNGLAGVVMLFTVIIVVSGILGRYIYTAVPRNVDGIELESFEIEQRIKDLDGVIHSWLESHPDRFRQFSGRLSSMVPGTESGLIFGRLFDDWNVRLKWWRESRRMDRDARMQANQLNDLLLRERMLNRQLSSIVVGRRLLGLWHGIHIPIGMVLFVAAFIHIIAAIYYATLLH